MTDRNHLDARLDAVDVVPGHIAVRGAQENNLRDLDIDIPRDTVVAFTGISGSGKSSLAFGTIFAQANQRYLESVSPYARRLLNQGSAPKVRHITGLPPAVALRQQHGGGSTRSSVGTVSRVSNVLRMLYSRSGTYPPGFRPADLAGSFPRDAAPLDSDSLRVATLQEIGNIVLNGVMGSIGNVLNRHITYIPPDYFEGGLSSLVDLESAPLVILYVRTRFEIESLEVGGDIIVVFQLESFDVLLGALRDLIHGADGNAS